jgi:FixJ family two-component response regulator
VQFRSGPGQFYSRGVLVEHVLSQPLTISIVDDDDCVREALVGLMQSHGFHAESFESSIGFLGSETLHRTDCLIADMHMPGMTGLALFDALGSAGRRIPTILITARHNVETRERALLSGVYCYLPKPFAEAELLHCVRSATGTRID